MGHVHVGSMYRLRCKEVKESLCDFLTIFLSFESKNVKGKISRRYVARYVTSTHHKWRHYQGCLKRHPITFRGQINVDEQKLAGFFGNVAHFVAYKNAACQSLIGCGA